MNTRSFIASVVLLLGVFAAGGSDASVTYTYDPAGRVTTAHYDNGACIAYSYDAASNRTAQTNTVGGSPVTPTWGTGAWGCFVWTP
jgi:YD repeat-containing protein